MEKLVLIVHVLAALSIVGLILMQQGKGASMGASFGSGASQTVFGGQGGAGFLVRTTAVIALIFFVTSFSLAVIAKRAAAPVDDLGIPGLGQEVPTVEQLEENNNSDVPAIEVTPVDTNAEIPVVEEPELEIEPADSADVPEPDGQQ